MEKKLNCNENMKNRKDMLTAGSYRNKQNIRSCGQSNLVGKILKGIDGDEFTLYYQPEYNLETKKVIGVEALARWISPDNYMAITPDVFIPIAEKSGLIYELDRMMLHKALKQKMIWEKEGLEHIELSINLSGKTVENEMAFRVIEEIIASYTVNYKTVIIEITETMIIKGIDSVVERLNRLRKYGIRFALDDFGTGYSSLIHMIKLPIDIIKIDRSFIKSIPKCSEETVITKNILAMAHDLNFKVVAEGIENVEQLEYLKVNSCEGGQGFLLCGPLPSDEVEGIIRGEI